MVAREANGPDPVDPAAGAAAGTAVDPVVATALEHGARGALFVASVSVLLLLLGWLAFYFLLFLPRGPIG